MKLRAQKSLLILLSLLMVLSCFVPEAMAEKKESKKNAVIEQVTETDQPSSEVVEKSGKQKTKKTKSESASAEKANATNKKTVAPRKVIISGSTSVQKGKTIQLSAKVTPSGAPQTVTWKTGNKAIATVSAKGVVTGKKAGTVKITATSTTNKKIKATVTVTVKEAESKTKKVTVSAPSTTLNLQQKTMQLKAKATPKDAPQKFTWKSSNPKVAKVDSNGVVTAVAEGTATITATAKDGTKKKGSVKIKVVKEYVKLTWVQGTSPAPKDNEKVLEYLNGILRERLGCEVEILYMSSDEVRASIESGEVYDMYFTCSWFNEFNRNVADGNFANLSKDDENLVKEWAPELWNALPENVWLLAQSTGDSLPYGDGLYAIPVFKDIAPENFIVYDAQIAEEAGIEIPDSIESWDELTPYLKALKEAMKKNPELGTYPVNIAGSPIGIDSSFDYISRTALIGVKPGDTKVISILDDPEILERYRTMHKWYMLGYVNPDAPILPDGSIDNSQHHISFVQAWDGYDYTPSRGFWVKMTRYSGPFLSSDGVQGAMNAFSVNLENDPVRFEKAMEFQELINTDQEVRDILAYGIPGEHFEYRDVKGDDGKVQGQAVVRTENGKESYTPWRFSQANYVINSIEASEETLDGTLPAPDLQQWDRYLENVKDAPVSKISGFTFDYLNPVDFSGNYAEISALKEEYLKNIQCGAVDPDDPQLGVLAFRKKLEAAGLNEIIAEAQRQLDAHLASK